MKRFETRECCFGPRFDMCMRARQERPDEREGSDRDSGSCMRPPCPRSLGILNTEEWAKIRAWRVRHMLRCMEDQSTGAVKNRMRITNLNKSPLDNQLLNALL